MTVYTYSRIPAFNPNTSPSSVAKSATGSVYDKGDTGFLTPLNVTLVVGGSVSTTLISDANGMFPDFTLLDRTSVVFKSGSISFVLTTSDPVPGPKGDTGAVSTVPGPAGPATTDASLLASGTVAEARLPSNLAAASLSATYASVITPEKFSGTDAQKLQAALDAVTGATSTEINLTRVYTLTTGLTITGKSNFRITAQPGCGLKRDASFMGDLITLDTCDQWSIEGLSIAMDNGLVVTTNTADLVAGSATTIPVVSTAGYPTSGQLWATNATTEQAINYTGKTATAFTGVNLSTLSGTIPAGTRIRPAAGDGIVINGCRDWTVKGSYFTGNYYFRNEQGICVNSKGTYAVDPTYGYQVPTYTRRSENGFITGNVFDTIGSEAIIFRDGVQWLDVSDNRITNCYGTGITAKGNNSVVARNIVRGCYLGLETNAEASVAAMGNDITFVDNLVDACTYAGIFSNTTSTTLAAAGLPVTGARIINNHVTNSINYGIMLNYSARPTIEGNKVDGVTAGPIAAGIGISIYNCADPVVTDNIVRGAADRPFYTAIAPRMICQGNKFTTAGASCYFEQLTDAIVTGNAFLGAASGGTYTGTGGVQIHFSTGVRFSNNRILNGEFGLKVTGNSSGIDIVSNAMRNLGKDAVAVDGSGGYTLSSVTVRDNTIREISQITTGTYSGVTVTQASLVYVEYNLITTTGTNKPLYGVVFNAGVTASRERGNTIVGTTSTNVPAVNDSTGANYISTTGPVGGLQISLTNTSGGSLSIGNTGSGNRRAIYLFQGDAPGDCSAIFATDGATIFPIYTGALVAVASGGTSSTNPAAAGKFNLYLSGTAMYCVNNYGSTRNVKLTPMSFQ